MYFLENLSSGKNHPTLEISLVPFDWDLYLFDYGAVLVLIFFYALHLRSSFGPYFDSIACIMHLNLIMLVLWQANDFSI